MRKILWTITSKDNWLKLGIIWSRRCVLIFQGSLCQHVPSPQLSALKDPHHILAPDGGLNEKCAPWAHASAHLGHGWWCCLKGYGNSGAGGSTPLGADFGGSWSHPSVHPLCFLCVDDTMASQLSVLMSCHVFAHRGQTLSPWNPELKGSLFLKFCCLSHFTTEFKSNKYGPHPGILCTIASVCFPLL